MTEIFADVPQIARDIAETAFNMAMQMDVEAAANFLNEITNSVKDEYLQDFYNFYFNMRMEALSNEDTNDQR